MDYYLNKSLSNIEYLDETNHLQLEIWKDIEGFENKYQVSDLGRFKSLNFHRQGIPKILFQEITKTGYLRVSLYEKSKKHRFLCHRLVAIAFIHNPDNKPQVNHKSGIKHNNSKINLEWNTMSENIIHSFKNGFHNSEKGEKRNNSKLTEKDVLEIRNIGRTKTLNLIAKDYGVSFQLISNIINRKCWRHI